MTHGPTDGAPWESALKIAWHDQRGGKYYPPRNVPCQPASVMTDPRANARVKRWCFTVNNPVFCVDYFKILSEDVRCLRFIYGTERGATGTRHLQGYIEFKRPLRFSTVTAILPAHWECSKGSARVNYRYCSKESQYEVFGDWSSESSVPRRNGVSSGKKFLSSDIVEQLCSSERQNALVRSEYIRHKRSIDDVVFEILECRVRHARYDELRYSFVSSWQSECIVHTYEQNRRQVCWYIDEVGNCGKSYLASLFQYVYSYDLFDGVTSARDICFLISLFPKGFVIDVTRKSRDHFSYSTLEMLKNGFIMTGKYQGIRKHFVPVPVIVFANFEPDTSALSADRWCLHYLKENGSTTPCHPLPKEPCPPPPLATPQETQDEEEDSS